MGPEEEAAKAEAKAKGEDKGEAKAKGEGEDKGEGEGKGKGEGGLLSRAVLRDACSLLLEDAPEHPLLAAVEADALGVAGWAEKPGAAAPEGGFLSVICFQVTSVTS